MGWRGTAGAADPRPRGRALPLRDVNADRRERSWARHLRGAARGAARRTGHAPAAFDPATVTAITSARGDRQWRAERTRRRLVGRRAADRHGRLPARSGRPGRDHADRDRARHAARARPRSAAGLDRADATGAPPIVCSSARAIRRRPASTCASAPTAVVLTGALLLGTSRRSSARSVRHAGARSRAVPGSCDNGRRRSGASAPSAAARWSAR